MATLNDVKAMLKSKGIKEDSWGNYKFKNSVREYRIKLNPKAIRVERKLGNGWSNCSSTSTPLYYSKLDLEKFGEYISNLQFK